MADGLPNLWIPKVIKRVAAIPLLATGKLDLRACDRLAPRGRSSGDRAMSVLGIGMDIVETKRIAESMERFGDRFLKRIFSEEEVAYARSMKTPELHLAARFAAKEAISKAFGTGIGHEMGWRDLEIRREANGQPRVQLHGQSGRIRAEARRDGGACESFPHGGLRRGQRGD